jgi:hypothetical protein
VPESPGVVLDVCDLPRVRVENEDAARQGGAPLLGERRDGEGHVVVVPEQQDVPALERTGTLHEEHAPQGGLWRAGRLVELNVDSRALFEAAGECREQGPEALVELARFGTRCRRLVAPARGKREGALGEGSALGGERHPGPAPEQLLLLELAPHRGEHGNGNSELAGQLAHAAPLVAVDCAEHRLHARCALPQRRRLCDSFEDVHGAG